MFTPRIELLISLLFWLSIPAAILVGSFWVWVGFGLIPLLLSSVISTTDSAEHSLRIQAEQERLRALLENAERAERMRREVARTMRESASHPLGIASTIPTCWDLVLMRLETRLDRRSFDAWFRQTHLLKDTYTDIYVGVPTTLVRAWITEHYMEEIERALSEVGRPGCRVAFVTDQEDL